MPTELKSSAIGGDEEPPQSQAAADFSADVSLVLDALGRMEATARADRAAIERLRGFLGALAQTIGAAKAALAAGGDTATLLDELEHLADAMIETAGGVAIVKAVQPEPENVPTVTAVVSQFGSAEMAPDAEPPATIDAAHEAAVSELKAMLEAMNASVAPPAAAAEAEPVAAPEVASPEAALPEPAEPAAITPPPDTSSETAPPTAPAPAPRPGLFLEHELLASFERMGAVPLLPPEEGTAVIFPRKPDTSAAATLAVPQIVEAAPAPDIAAASPEPEIAAAASVVEPEAVSPTAATETIEATATPVAEFAPPAKPETPPPAAAAAPEVSPALTPPEPEFDPDEFLFGAESKPDPALFGPEPEPDPDAFLLEPVPIVPPRLAAAALPQPDFVSAASAPADARSSQAPADPAPAEPAPPPASRVHDPLHALNAMSEWEKLALFS